MCMQKHANKRNHQDLKCNCRGPTIIGHTGKVVVIDGVGYPAVGSIVGVSNATVAATLDAPVVLARRLTNRRTCDHQLHEESHAF